ncbi:related to CYB2 - L-lactate dehydrogenase (cytochrome b2) [Cephalotrichum gorgonifer]|uniref:L-lactate dehydrogenase (cytochrome) n=1 Tax=Cephalotrichum gorgonifer TaxID=2041049 RepID=A0AAE8MV52_9PEZI|nr:related to CYB2 - L-lactate dehydrogenase (cytochrome b2) [Cephalotrichum gorgonifer]
MDHPNAPKPPLSSLISLADFERAAEKTFTPKAWAFVSSAATDLHTKTRNASAYSQIGLRPRVLRDVSSVDTSCTMLGRRVRLPIFCSPTSMARTVHPGAEGELGRGLKAVGVPMCVSSSASMPLADIIGEIGTAPADIRPKDGAEGGVERTGELPVFLQLYVDKTRANSEKLLRTARDLGVKAVFLTVDSALPGKREADERVRADESVSSAMTGITARNDAKGGALGRVMGGHIDPSLSWSDLPWLRRCLPDVPIVLKGIQTWMDAKRALDAGADGIVVSNHGGRNLDTSPATILVLLEIRRNCPEVFDELEVYIDGGITRGTDIFKALCLGARAVGLGRGFLHALNYGEEGIRRFVEILQDELETTMKLCGVTSLRDLHPGLLNTLAVDHLIPGIDDHLAPEERRRLGSKL